MPGGHSEMRVPDEEHLEKFHSWRETVEAQAGKTFEHFHAVGYTQQVVAGMVYHVKYHVGGDEHIHAKVFQPLPHTGEAATCQAVVEGKSAEDAIEHL